MALTPEQRHAQRVWVGVIRAGGAQLYPDGLRAWRSKDAGEYMTSAQDLTQCLEALGVRYTVDVRRGRSNRFEREMGFEVHVDTADLPALAAWIPMLNRLVDALAGG